MSIEATLRVRLHVGLCCAVPNARRVEYIPQLDGVTRTGMTIADGYAVPGVEPGLGIDWDLDALRHYRAEGSERVLNG